MAVARRISILLFLLFYFASSLLASGYRAVREARRVLRAATRVVNVQIGQWSKQSEDSHPRYREAKKAGVEFDFRSALAVSLTPRVIRFEFTVFLLYWEAHHVFGVPGTRAPPFHA